MEDNELLGMSVDEIREQIVSLVQKLGEYGHVQVLLSYSTKNDETITIIEGEGNWHARVNMARNFVRRADKMEDLDTESEYNGIDDDDGEDWKHEHEPAQ